MMKHNASSCEKIKMRSAMKSIIILIIITVLSMIGCSHYIESDSQVILPTVKSLPALIYPKMAQQNNYFGNTTVEIFISKTGHVFDARIISSSGYSVLDTAAKEYCEKIVFNPAMANGIPINSRSIFKIKFDLSDQETFGKMYVTQIKKLYSQLSNANETEKYILQNEILMKHREFIGNMNEKANYNPVIMKILLPDITEQWQAYTKNCPLTFLIYHDFLNRFPDYKDNSNVKIELKNTVIKNLEKLERISADKFDKVSEKDNLLFLIKNFIQKNYPDLNLNNVKGQALNS